MNVIVSRSAAWARSVEALDSSADRAKVSFFSVRRKLKGGKNKLQDANFLSVVSSFGEK